MKIKLLTGGLLLFLPIYFVLGQESLLDQLKAKSEPPEAITASTFKALRLINGHTIEMRDKGNLEFLIAHRFGKINSGAYQFFGMDQANMRLGLDYALLDGVTIGLGRNSFKKIYDGFIKFAIIKQKLTKSPVTIIWFSNMAINSLRRPELPMNFGRRLNYTHQALVARKFNSLVSIQLMPTYIHRNMVINKEDPNGIMAMGTGISYKITNSVNLNVEYYYRFVDDQFQNPIAIGFDIETGGHVFQLHLTNAQEMTETGFIPATSGNFFQGDIHFGFNITRNFQLGPPNTRR